MRWTLHGTIAAAGFASGDTFVVGRWDDGPLGAMTDVMWARPDGERVLLAPDQAVADLVAGLYSFDRIELVPITAGGGPGWLELKAGPLELQARASSGWPLPKRRPRWVTRYLEGPIARVAMDVRTYGTTRTGVEQWYQAERFRPITAAWATLDGVDLGALGPVARAGFSFSDAPTRPSMVTVHPVLHDPSGRFDEVVLGAARLRIA